MSILFFCSTTPTAIMLRPAKYVFKHAIRIYVYIRAAYDTIHAIDGFVSLPAFRQSILSCMAWGFNGGSPKSLAISRPPGPASVAQNPPRSKLRIHDLYFRSHGHEDYESDGSHESDEGHAVWKLKEKSERGQGREGWRKKRQGSQDHPVAVRGNLSGPLPGASPRQFQL